MSLFPEDHPLLSYRHGFHAGNHADVFKHAALSLLLGAFRQKEKPFIYLDTHAGGGLYDLQGNKALKTREAFGGIGRLWNERASWPELADYFQAIAAHNPDGNLQYYPGSPDLARQLTRSQDKLCLLELHPAEIQDLRQNFGFDTRISIHERDAFEGLIALLPPTPKRGLVLIDPPYEQRSEYTQLQSVLAKAFQRWSTGTYVIWYPQLARDRDYSLQLLHGLKKGPYPNLLVAELSVSMQAIDLGMHGSGLAIINPPWQLDTQLRALLPRLTQALKLDGHATWRVEWLLQAS